ncbi:GIY-YIG nuclease family protein [Siccirubricoccus deserti]|uniref:GIY-YIG nuclease family protein n=1 Tax=Siccirubricoccus deserti TaxID=2013562 RepID=UPI0036F3F417
MEGTPTAEDRRLYSLLDPGQLFTPPEVLSRRCPVPHVPGAYAWYFDEVPPGVPTDGCHTFSGFTLLYVGIAPKAPPTNGRKASATHLQHRIGYHFRGNAEGSTLRLTLGCLLASRLNIQLQRVGSGKTKTFTNPGEQRLDVWMADHARVVWVATDQPWQLEERLIADLSLPLNLAGNSRHPYSKTLKAIRSEAKAKAAMMPIAERGGARRLDAGVPRPT